MDAEESDFSDFEDSGEDYIPLESDSNESSDDDSDYTIPIIDSGSEEMDAETNENNNHGDDLHDIQDEPVWTEYEGRQKQFRFTGACIIQ